MQEDLVKYVKENERKGVVRLGHGTSEGLEGKTAWFT